MAIAPFSRIAAIVRRRLLIACVGAEVDWRRRRVRLCDLRRVQILGIVWPCDQHYRLMVSDRMNTPTLGNGSRPARIRRPRAHCWRRG